MLAHNRLKSDNLKFDDRLLHRAVVDQDFRDELLENLEVFADHSMLEKLFQMLPIPVQPQDKSFVELIKEASNIATRQMTYVTGVTITVTNPTMVHMCADVSVFQATRSGAMDELPNI